MFLLYVREVTNSVVLTRCTNYSLERRPPRRRRKCRDFGPIWYLSSLREIRSVSFWHARTLCYFRLAAAAAAAVGRAVMRLPRAATASLVHLCLRDWGGVLCMQRAAAPRVSSSAPKLSWRHRAPARRWLNPYEQQHQPRFLLRAR